MAWLILPGSNVTWSLAVEEQFYILFALIWMFFVGKKWWRPALATTACAAIVIANLIRSIFSPLLMLQFESCGALIRGWIRLLGAF